MLEVKRQVTRYCNPCVIYGEFDGLEFVSPCMWAFLRLVVKIFHTFLERDNQGLL